MFLSGLSINPTTAPDIAYSFLVGASKGAPFGVADKREPTVFAPSDSRKPKVLVAFSPGVVQLLVNRLREIMKLTIFILLLPVMALLLAVFGTPLLQAVSFFTCLLSSVVCLVWGFYISRRSRFFGWLCVLAGVAPLVLMLLPVHSA
jgi:hypothetical protein